MVRLNALTRCLNTDGMNPWGDSAYTPLNAAVIARPQIMGGAGVLVARFGGEGVGNIVGQSYRGVHPPR